MPNYEEMIPERYRVSYDKATGSFHILDTWHESIKNMPDISGEIPSNSPALKIITSMEINSLLGVLDQMGWMQKYKTNFGKPDMVVGERSKTIHEISIESIKAIVESTATDKQADKDVAKSAVDAIQQITRDLNRGS